jgi:hypothetical protein
VKCYLTFDHQQKEKKMKMKRDNNTVPAAYLIERPTQSKKVIARHSDTVAKFENRFLSAIVKDLGKGIRPPAPPRPSPPTLPAADFSQLVIEEQAKFFRFMPELLPIPIARGTRVLSPPYDNSWQTGAGSPLSHLDGRPLTMATDGGSTSGFCIYISSPTRVFATVNFQGSYKFNWVSLDNRPDLRVSGGLGACVYKGNDAAPLMVRRSILFTVRGPRAFDGGQGEGQLSSVLVGSSEPSPNTFASYLLPVSLLMEPSVNYAVWLWCWHAAVGTTGAPFLSFVTCDVPAVTVTTSEPYFPPLH